MKNMDLRTRLENKLSKKVISIITGSIRKEKLKKIIDKVWSKMTNFR